MYIAGTLNITKQQGTHDVSEYTLPAKRFRTIIPIFYKSND